MRQIDEFIDFMRRLYNQDVDEESLVTVISFSEIRKSA